MSINNILLFTNIVKQFYMYFKSVPDEFRLVLILLQVPITLDYCYTKRNKNSWIVFDVHQYKVLQTCSYEHTEQKQSTTTILIQPPGYASTRGVSSYPARVSGYMSSGTHVLVAGCIYIPIYHNNPYPTARTGWNSLDNICLN